MEKVIIYGSEYGSTKEYAQELAKETNINAVSYTSISDLSKYSTIVYMGGVYAGGVKGLKKTMKLLKENNETKIIIATVCLSDVNDEQNITNLRKGLKKQLTDKVYEKSTFFHLRGGIDYSILSFKHRMMMKFLYKKLKTIPEEEQSVEVKSLLETYGKKVSYIDFNYLAPIIEELEK